MVDKTLAIIVAGGRGSRMAGSTSIDGINSPKQYLKLNKRTILDLAINKFTSHNDVDAVLVVIHNDDKKIYHDTLTPHDKLLPPVIGGNSRRQSVLNGLTAAIDLGVFSKVLIHDAARPFVEEQTIAAVVSAIRPGHGAIPANAVVDTLKESNPSQHVRKTISREFLYCAQTPQGFMLADITRVHKKADRLSQDQQTKQAFTDDASMFEWDGLDVELISAPASNFKITTQDDLARAKQIAQTSREMIMHPDIRTGNGYDVHAFEPGIAIILCGVSIPFHKKLKGHSDADVALHALTDAILGTIGAGDIGTHFPPSDQQWLNVESSFFLHAALKLVKEKGGILNHVDITLICEEPKIGPHRETLRAELARLCDIDIDRASLKATTNEKLGFIGRKEGISAIATATVSFGDRF